MHTFAGNAGKNRENMKKFDFPLFADTLFLFAAAGLLALCLFRSSHKILLSPLTGPCASCNMKLAS